MFACCLDIKLSYPLPPKQADSHADAEAEYEYEGFLIAQFNEFAEMFTGCGKIKDYYNGYEKKGGYMLGYGYVELSSSDLSEIQAACRQIEAAKKRYGENLEISSRK